MRKEAEEPMKKEAVRRIGGHEEGRVRGEGGGHEEGRGAEEEGRPLRRKMP